MPREPPCGDGVKESKGGRVLEAWKNLDVVRSALSVVRLRNPPTDPTWDGDPGRAAQGQGLDGGIAVRQLRAGVGGRTVQGLHAVLREEGTRAGQERTQEGHTEPLAACSCTTLHLCDGCCCLGRLC